MGDIKRSEKAESQPEVKMSAAKLDRDGNVVGEVSFENVEAHISPGFLADLKQAAREGWNEGKGDKNG